jgi:uncharacterized membrane protein
MHQKPVTAWGRFIHRLNHIRSITRLLISVAFALLMSFLLLPVHMEALTRVMLGWDFYCLCVMVLVGTSWATMQPQQIRLLAKKQDSSRGVVFVLVLISCLTSLVAVLDLLGHKKAWVLDRGTEAAIYLSGVALSWVLLHTIFTHRYAHAYYGDHPNNPDQQAGGLQIPGDDAPTYVDFAYFSFVIGMTFQVSDIAITSSRIRKWVLIHGLLSFLFNTVIVALTINEVVSLQP